MSADGASACTGASGLSGGRRHTALRHAVIGLGGAKQFEQSPGRSKVSAGRHQAALDKVGLALLDSHVDHCVMGSAGQLRENRIAEVMAAVARLMRRG